eukprot:403371753
MTGGTFKKNEEAEAMAYQQGEGSIFEWAQQVSLKFKSIGLYGYVEYDPQSTNYTLQRFGLFLVLHLIMLMFFLENKQDHKMWTCHMHGYLVHLVSIVRRNGICQVPKRQQSLVNSRHIQLV